MTHSLKHSTNQTFWPLQDMASLGTHSELSLEGIAHETFNELWHDQFRELLQNLQLLKLWRLPRGCSECKRVYEVGGPNHNLGKSMPYRPRLPCPIFGTNLRKQRKRASGADECVADLSSTE